MLAARCHIKTPMATIHRLTMRVNSILQEGPPSPHPSSLIQLLSDEGPHWSFKVTINVVQTNAAPSQYPLPTYRSSTTKSQSLHAFRGSRS
jgi:hypothetical protein